MSEANASLYSQAAVLKFLLELPQIYGTASLRFHLTGRSKIIALEGARLAPYGAP